MQACLWNKRSFLGPAAGAWFTTAHQQQAQKRQVGAQSPQLDQLPFHVHTWQPVSTMELEMLASDFKINNTPLS